MAKESKIVKNLQRREIVARYAERRTALKTTIKNPATSYDDRAAAVRALSRLPRDSSPVRLRNRDVVDGRPRGFLRKAGISRVRFRTMPIGASCPASRSPAGDSGGRTEAQAVPKQHPAPPLRVAGDPDRPGPRHRPGPGHPGAAAAGPGLPARSDRSRRMSPEPLSEAESPPQHCERVLDARCGTGASLEYGRGIGNCCLLTPRAVRRRQP